jgi:tRNA threonylcarbamoyladenosine biosynthesis protein TsaB
MPRIAAIDTTSEYGSLALIQDGEVLEELLVASPDGFGHVIFPQLEALLNRHGWLPASVDCFACASGPGSFTGIRVGLSAVKGLGEALNKPVVAVSNLRAIAWHGKRSFRAAVLDARRGELYGAVFSASLELVKPEAVLPCSVWAETLPEGELEILSTDFSAFRHILAAPRFAHSSLTVVPQALAGAVGRIASDYLASGAAARPEEADANYVRRSDAELLWKEH